MSAVASTRRAFLQGGGALLVAIQWPLRAAEPPKPANLPGSLQTNRLLGSWLAIDPDGSVTIFSGKVDLGQGISTAIAQIAADELDVDLRRVRMVTGDTARTPDEGWTAGSLSAELGGTAVRYACAEARDLLLAAAATKLAVPQGDLRVVDGIVRAASGRGVTYWELVGSIDLKREATASVAPKAPAQHRYVGQSVPRRDAPRKVTGQRAYVQDLRMPGMLFGRVVRPPMPGARLRSVDEAAARKMPGVVAVVRDGNFLGVVAEREEQAINARLALKESAVWIAGPELPDGTEGVFARMRASDVPVAVVSAKEGLAPGGRATRVAATYSKPYVSHGSIGPSCSVAQWHEDGTLGIWTHTQGVFPLRGDMARFFKLPPDRIRCTHVEGSGCYGQNGADDVALDAALVARAVRGRPVKLQWMRDDEFGHEPYGSAMIMTLGASLGSTGEVIDWTHELWSYSHNRRPGYGMDGVNLLAAWDVAEPAKPSSSPDMPQPAGGADRNSVPLYVFPRQKISKHYLTDAPLRTSALRTLGGYANVFAIESFMDELAAASGQDPAAFRLRHLQDERAREVIRTVVRHSRWQPGTRGPADRGWGLAFARYKNHGCYCAVVVEVRVDRKTGDVSVLHATAAVDAGEVINPDGIRNQIEGGLIQSTSWTLFESVGFGPQGVTTRSWVDYPVIRFEDVPSVEVVLIDRPGQPFLGVGEGSQGPTSAAIANAVADATGKRVRDLPLSPERVLSALA